MIVDLRSDTSTLPTQEMYDAMNKAPLGDDVRGEDPTVNKLQEFAAEITGKQKALFFPTGTMANLTAIMVHTNERRSEILVEKGSHILLNEAGGYAHIAGVSLRTIEGDKGSMSADSIIENLRNPNNIHHPVTRLVCMENTHNSAGGTVIPMENMKTFTNKARELGISSHLDGARIFNAACYLNVKASDIAANFDSVMFCLSKGLSAPVGSMLTGSADFIDSALKIRKILGGGMRQAGILAAAGLVALKQMTSRVIQDHETARIIGEGIYGSKGIHLDLDTVQTNMVKFDVTFEKIDGAAFLSHMEREGVLGLCQGPRTIRLVTSRHTSKKDAEEAALRINKIAKTL